MPNSSADLALTQAPTVEVRQDGQLLARVSVAASAELIELGWAVRRGAHVVKYIELLPGAPWRPAAGWRGGSHTTRPVRADQTTKRYRDGQLMGNPRFLREHKPL
jgi:hypothetical protein